MRPTLHAVPVRKLKAGSLMRDIHGLAPGGVYRAPIITDGAVVSYTTISPFSRPVPINQDGAGCVFSVTLSVPAGFCPRDPRLTRGALPCGVRTFLPVPSFNETERLPCRPYLLFVACSLRSGELRSEQKYQPCPLT